MLTLKKPIQLKAGLKPSIAADSFYRRLSGNYEIIASRIAPKDLLFLLTQPPQFPEDLFGASQFNITNSYTDARRVTIEAVNNLVNRILLSTEPDFTYQDNVYITTMLNKLGITDVKQFMREIRRVKAEQADQLELTKLYKNEINRTIQKLKTVQPQQNITVASAEKHSEKPVTPVPRCYLHQDIYERLETGDLYQEVNNIHNGYSKYDTNISRNELRLAEQLRISRDLNLTDARKNYFSTTAPTMEHHINRYERGDALVPPTTEEEVIAQAAQAALFSTVERVIAQTIEREKQLSGSWLNIANNLHQTAENSLKRFESWHSDTAFNHYNIENYNDWRRNMTTQEIDTLRQLEKTNTELLRLEHIKTDAPRQDETVLPTVSPNERPRLVIERSHELTDKLHSLFKLESEIQLREEQQQLKTVFEPQLERQQQTIINAMHQTLRRETERINSDVHDRTETLKTTERELKTVEQQFEEPAVAPQQQTVLRESSELISRELKEIDRQNRERLEMMKLVQQRKEPTPRLTPPDSRRIMRDALRALESPEVVLEELAAKSAKAPQPTNEIERILSHTDSTTRQIIETVMQYERDPAKALQSGMIRANDLATLNAEAAAKQQQPAIIEHIKPEISQNVLQQAAEQTAKTLEQLSERSAEQIPTQRKAGKWSEMPIVFRRENNNFVEELVEMLEQQRTQNIQRQNVHEDVIRQNVSQTEVHEQNSNIVTHTAEDITEIVNRQMARQMNVLTDQVYRQMERKLQTERIRRGRF